MKIEVPIACSINFLAIGLLPLYNFSWYKWHSSIIVDFFLADMYRGFYEEKFYRIIVMAVSRKYLQQLPVNAINPNIFVSTVTCRLVNDVASWGTPSISIHLLSEPLQLWELIYGINTTERKSPSNMPEAMKLGSFYCRKYVIPSLLLWKVCCMWLKNISATNKDHDLLCSTSTTDAVTWGKTENCDCSHLYYIFHVPQIMEVAVFHRYRCMILSLAQWKILCLELQDVLAISN